MRHINTRQIDQHCWEIEVTDGYQIEWTAKFNGFQANLMTIHYGQNRKVAGEVNLKGSTESTVLGDAVALVYNWVQLGAQCNELLDKRWRVLDKNLHRHFDGG